MASNRTSVELKYINEFYALPQSQPSNRTSVELKFASRGRKRQAGVGF